MSPFFASSAPVVVRHAFLTVSIIIWGKHTNYDVLELKNQRIFLIRSPKIFAHLRRYFQLCFGQTLCRLPLPQLRAGSAPDDTSLKTGRASATSVEFLMLYSYHSINKNKQNYLSFRQHPRPHYKTVLSTGCLKKIVRCLIKYNDTLNGNLVK